MASKRWYSVVIVVSACALCLSVPLQDVADDVRTDPESVGKSQETVSGRHLNSTETPAIKSNIESEGYVLLVRLLRFLLGNDVLKVQRVDDDEGQDTTNNTGLVSHTAITYDPFGALANKVKDSLYELVNFPSFEEWITTVVLNTQDFSPFIPERTYDPQDSKDGSFTSLFPYVFVGSDFLKFALNFLAFLGIQSLFWRVYLPVYGIPKYNDYYNDDLDYGDEEDFYDDDYDGDGADEEEEEENDYFDQYENGRVTERFHKPAGTHHGASYQTTHHGYTYHTHGSGKHTRAPLPYLYPQ